MVKLRFNLFIEVKYKIHMQLTIAESPPIISNFFFHPHTKYLAQIKAHLQEIVRCSLSKTRFKCHFVAVKLKRTDSDSMKFKSLQRRKKEKEVPASGPTLRTCVMDTR
jgi:hypothetical protein